MLDLLQPFTEGVEERDASSSTARGGPKHAVVEEKNLLMRNFPRLPPIRGEVKWEKISRVRKESSFPNQEEITMCSLIF